MTVSVIIPAYNCERYIERALESVLLQTGAELDVIVINDGSTDATAKVLEKYKDKVRIITTENGGSAAARNKGIELAEGDFVMFLDSDDWLSQGTIEKLSKVMSETGADIAKFRYKCVFPDGREEIGENQFDSYDVVEKSEFKKKIYPYFISGIRLNSMCAGIYKKEIIKGRKFREDMRVAEDAVFALGTFTAAKKAVILPDVLYNYYQTGTGLTGSGAKIVEKYRCNFLFAAETSKLLKAWDMDSFAVRTRVYLRPVLLTFDKLRRIKKSKKGR